MNTNPAPTMEQQIAAYKKLGNALKTSPFYRVNKCVVDQMMSTIKDLQERGGLTSDDNGILVFPMLPISLLNHGDFGYNFYIENDVKLSIKDISPYIMYPGIGGKIGKPIDLATAIQFGIISRLSDCLYVEDVYFALSPERNKTNGYWRIHKGMPNRPFENFRAEMVPV